MHEVPLLAATDPSPPADPSLFSRWLFEDPTTPVIVLGLFAVALLLHAWLRRGKAALYAGLAFAGVALALVLTAMLVETGRERFTALTLQLVEAAGRGDAQTVESMSARDVKVTFPGGAVWYDGRAETMDAYEHFVIKGGVGIADVSVTGAEARADGSAVARVVVMPTFAGLRQGMEAPMVWLFVWRSEDGQPHVVNYHFMKYAGREASRGMMR